MDTMEQQPQHHQDDTKMTTDVTDDLSRLDVQNAVQQNPDGSQTTTTSSSHGQAGPLTTDQQAQQQQAAVQLRDPQSIGKLHELCQARGLPQPKFEFPQAGLQLFTARLEIGEYLEISLSTPFPSKKAAKEAIAAQGLEMLQNSSHSSRTGINVQPQQPEINWIGNLLGKFHNQHSSYATVSISIPIPLRLIRDGTEFYQRHPRSTGPRWKEYSFGQHHSCDCIIDNRPDIPFGGISRLFRSKKAAKANAAREAWLWLKQEGLVQ